MMRIWLQRKMLLGSLTSVLMLTLVPCVQAVEMSFNGALVAEPCVIAPGDETILLDFGSVVDKYLYTNERTPASAFSLTLSECTTDIAKSIAITFSGNESHNLPGLLAIGSGSTASGIAVGLETITGRPVGLNQQGEMLNLEEGSNIIRLQAYVRGEPQALSAQAIEYGPFSAVATFNLDYQ